MGDDKKYKKRVIQASSSDEGSDDDVPLVSPPCFLRPSQPAGRRRVSRLQVIGWVARRSINTIHDHGATGGCLAHVDGYPARSRSRKHQLERLMQATGATRRILMGSLQTFRSSREPALTLHRSRSQVKRVKAEDSAAAVLPMPSGADSPSALAAANAPVPAPLAPEVEMPDAQQQNGSKGKVSVFTTGESDEDSSDGDVPLAKKAASNGKVKRETQSPAAAAPAKVSKKVQEHVKKEMEVANAVAQTAKKIDKEQEDSDDADDSDSSSSEEEKPLAQVAKRASSSKGKGKKPAPKKGKKADSSDEESAGGDDDESDFESDAPLSKKVAAKKRAPAKKGTAPAKAKKAAVKKEESASPQKKGKGRAKKEDTEDLKSEDGEEVHKWWEEDQNGETKVSGVSVGLPESACSV